MLSEIYEVAAIMKVRLGYIEMDNVIVDNVECVRVEAACQSCNRHWTLRGVTEVKESSLGLQAHEF